MSIIEKTSSQQFQEIETPITPFDALELRNQSSEEIVERKDSANK